MWALVLVILHLISRQDSESYRAKQISAGVSSSVAYGSGGSASANVSYQNAQVAYAQVNEQTGERVSGNSMMIISLNNKYLQKLFFPLLMLALVFLSYLTVSGEKTKKDNLKKLENMIYLLENQFGEVKKIESRNSSKSYFLLSFKHSDYNTNYNNKLLSLGFNKVRKSYCHNNSSIQVFFNFEQEGGMYFLYIAMDKNCIQ
ncbi:hypothetical protein [Avibacterium avium]|uniref:hypothetical protein n=1 Tax=Avibacterium avium TaxID=751 RepID=UPI0039FCED92